MYTSLAYLKVLTEKVIENPNVEGRKEKEGNEEKHQSKSKE